MFGVLKTKLTLTLSVLSVFFISQYSVPICQTKADTSVIGTWQGTLEAGGTKLRIVFHVSKTDSGTISATFDSPDQSAYGIPFSSLTVEKDSVHFVAALIGGAYDGRFALDQSAIVGFWKQRGAVVDLKLERSATALPPPKMERPQEPKPPYPYRSEEISFEDKPTGMKYSGTLTLPDSGGVFPAVILITGSGVHDRNEEIFGHKPFLVIADYLTRRGIAVFRVDDRGIGGSTGNKMAVTSADHAKDVIAEIEFLKSRHDIDKSQVGLVGHSEGGIIAPMVAAQSKDVSFVVLLAGTGVTGEEIILEQTKLMAEADSVPADKIDREIGVMEKEYGIMKSSNDSAAVAEKLKAYFVSLPKWSEDIKKGGGDPKKAIESQVESLLSPWFRYFIVYDPKPALEKVQCPVLVMDGTLDLQVPPIENQKAIEGALKKGGNKDYTIELMPGLNHLFQDAKTGSPKEYAQIEETFSPTALKLMGDWIEERTGKK